jgi:hypothetical protein
MFFTRTSKALTLALLLALCAAGVVMAHAPSGAIFTTVADGSEVNFNIYPSKDAVYLDGGPGIGAPQHAAGLDDGTYVFQVTEPSGKTLLSTDFAKCRQFVVADGIITGVVVTGCQHLTGFDVDHGAVTVQLMPYLDTPNPGGEYKAWVTTVEDFLAGCAELGVANGLEVVDCGSVAGNRHGFVPGHTKTDNFKVGPASNLEIDTRFFNESGVLLDGIGLTWTDTLGSTNKKYSYYKPQNMIEHFAHVEAVEAGVHQITIENQPGCTVKRIDKWDSKKQTSTSINGPGTVSVTVRQNDPEWTKYLYVYCQTTP